MNNRDTIGKARFIFDHLIEGKFIDNKKFEELTVTEVYHLQRFYDDLAKDFKPTERVYHDK